MTPLHDPPADDVLRRFLLGDLPPADAAQVEAWLGSDPAAPAILSRLDAVDPLVAAVAAVGDSAGISTRASASDDTSPATILWPGVDWAGYRVVGELGRGGMGIVYEMAEDRLGRRVAVKVLRPEFAAQAEAKARFLREARTMAAAADDHIVPVFRVDETPAGEPYLVMPLLAGQTLADRLSAGPLPIGDLIRVARDTAAGLAAAHGRGMIHRDVKPSNLWLESGPDGSFRRVRLLDFGLARGQSEDAQVTGSGQVLGTPAYMSPEQARGRPLDGRTDLFSLGAVLYRAATGRQPFSGETPSAVLTALAVDDPVPVRDLNPDVPVPLADLIMRLLKKNPADRPASAAAVIAELDRVDALPRPQPAEKGRKPRRVVALAAALLSVGLLALAGWVVIKVRRPDGKESTVKAPAGSGFTVAPNGDVTVTLPKAEPRDIMAARRKAAEWVRAVVKGEIEIVLPNGRWQWGWKELPPKFEIGRLLLHSNQVTDGALKEHLPALDGLRTLDLRNCPLTDESLTLLARLPHLQRLWCENVPGMTDKTLAAFAGHSALTELVIDGKQFTAAGLASLKTMPNFRSFGVNGVLLTDEWLAAVGAAKGIEGLRFSGVEAASRVTPGGLAHLKDLKWLRELILSGPAVNDAWLAPCAGMPVLERLELLNTRVGDAGLAHLAGLPKLGQLGLQKTRVTGEGMRHLAGCSSLWNLNISNLPIDDAGAAALAGSKSLRRVILRDTLVTDKGAAALAKVKTLEEFGGQECRLTDTGLEALAANPRVRAVGATGPDVTDRGVAALAKNPNMAVLVLPDTVVSDASVPALSALKKLERLDLTRTKLTAAGFAALKKALPRCNVEGAPATPADVMAARRKAAEWAMGLKAEVHLLLPDGRWQPTEKVSDLPATFEIGMLVLRDTLAVTDVTLKEHLPGLDGLRHLDIAGCANLTDDSVALIGKLPHLKQLLLGVLPGVTDRTFAALAGHPALTYVVLGHMKLTDEGLGALATIPNLQRLNVNMGPDRAAITAAGLVKLERARDLRHLSSQNIDLTPDGLLALGRVSTLTHLDIVQSQASAEGFENLARLTRLTTLTISETNVGDAHFKRLPPLPAVETLTLRFLLVGDSALEHLARWPELKSLILQKTEVKGDGLKHLAGCAKLRHLNLHDTPVTSAGLVALAGSGTLQGLHIDGTPMTDDAADALAGMRNLDWLHAFGCGVTERQAKALCLSRSLTQLHLSGPQIGDSFVKLFADKRRFIHLVFADSGVTDWSYPVLREMRHLKLLDVTRSRITPTGIGALRKALPKCEVRPAGPTPVHLTDGDRKALQWAFEQGAEVGLPHFNDHGRGFALKKGIKEVDDYLWADWLTPGLINFHRRPVLDEKSVENLRGLSMLHNLPLDYQPLGDGGFAKLASFPVAKSVVRLSLPHTGLTDAGAKHLPAFESAWSLKLNGARFTAAGAAHLRKMPALRALLWGDTLTDEALGAIKGLPLTELHININKDLTDVGLDAIATFTALEQLYLDSPQLTDAGVAKLLPSLEKLHFLYLGGKQLGPKTFAALGDCKRLGTLTLVRFPAGDAAKALRLPPATTRLTFVDSDISDATLDRLAGFKQLKEIIFQGVKLGEARAMKLSRALPECGVWTAEGVFVNGEKR